jgi:hypothetical protein
VGKYARKLEGWAAGEGKHRALGNLAALLCMSLAWLMRLLFKRQLFRTRRVGCEDASREYYGLQLDDHRRIKDEIS